MTNDKTRLCLPFCSPSAFPVQGGPVWWVTDASHNFPCNCFSPACSDTATVKSAFPPVLWHSCRGAIFPLDVSSPPPHSQTHADWADHLYWRDHGDSCPGCQAFGMTPITVRVPHGSHSLSPASLCSATFLESNPSLLTRRCATNDC